MRSMYSAFSFGTHHIFFPPRLQVVACQELSRGLALDLLDDATLLGLARDETDRPAGAAVWWCTADHRHNRALLGVIQHLLRDRAGFIRERRLDPLLKVPPSDPTHLARVCADGKPGVNQRPAGVQQLENADAPPVAFVKRAQPLQVVEVLAVSRRELQARKVGPPHPLL